MRSFGGVLPLFYYRADKFELVDTLFGTYPEHIDGYEGSFNDVKSKAWNLGVFRVKETGKLFIFVTTHLWWMSSDEYQAFSDEAREYQVAIVEEKIREFEEKYRCPAVLIGDLNTGYDSKAVKYLRDKGFCHAHDIATDFAEEAVGYHNCFRWGYEDFYSDAPFVTAIDHILVRGGQDGCVKRFERYSPDYYFPISDHSPAYIDIEL